jgi:hypothetical protein
MDMYAVDIRRQLKMDSKKNQDPSAKKPYNTPAFRVYGTIKDITAATSTPGPNADVRGLNMDLRTN